MRKQPGQGGFRMFSELREHGVRSIYILPKGEMEMKTGLIMEGGAMRGMFTAGVTDVMMEEGITFDGAIGVSAGAVFGCNYKSHQIGRSIRYNTAYCRDPRYASMRSLIRTGDLFGEQFCYHDIPDRLDVFDVETYQKNPMKFYVVCTDVKTGRPVYYECKKGDAEDIQWFRASASMPLVSKIVKIGDYELLDGGISDSIPIRCFEKMGYKKNVIILTQPLDYVKTPNKLLPLMRMALRKYPNVVRAMERRHKVYNRTTAYIKELEKQGKAYVIRPDAALNIKRVERDPKELKRVYEMGRKKAKAQLSDIKTFLQK